MLALKVLSREADCGGQVLRDWVAAGLLHGGLPLRAGGALGPALAMEHSPLLVHTPPYHTIPYNTELYHTIPYITVLYHNAPYYTIACMALVFHCTLVPPRAAAHPPPLAFLAPSVSRLSFLFFISFF